MLLLVSSVKLICEIALLALLGQGVLALLAGRKREQNFFYQILSIMTKPFVGLARWITPKVVLDSHVPIVAFLLLGFIWLVALIEKVKICKQIGVHLCQ